MPTILLLFYVQNKSTPCPKVIKVRCIYICSWNYGTGWLFTLGWPPPADPASRPPPPVARSEIRPVVPPAGGQPPPACAASPARWRALWAACVPLWGILWRWLAVCAPCHKKGLKNAYIIEETRLEQTCFFYYIHEKQAQPASRPLGAPKNKHFI